MVYKGSLNVSKEVAVKTKDGKDNDRFDYVVSRGEI